MINLLPPDQQKRSRTDYWHRVYIVLFFFVAGALGTLLLFLGLIYFTLMQTTSLGTPSTGSDSISTKEELEKELKLANDTLALFSVKDMGHLPIELLSELIRGDESFGVYLTAFAYTKGGENPKVLLSGNAKTRDALVRFLNHLRNKSMVLSVESPIESLSKSVDIPFSVTIDLKPYGGTTES